MVQWATSSRLRILAWSCGLIAAGSATYWVIRAMRGGLSDVSTIFAVFNFPIASACFVLQVTRRWSLGRRLLLPVLGQLLGTTVVTAWRSVSHGQATSPWVATFVACAALTVGWAVLDRYRKELPNPALNPTGLRPAG